MAVLLALAAGEAGVRVFGLGPDVFQIQRGMVRLTPDPGLRYELIPHYVSPLRDVVINAYGMRNRPVAPAKAPGVFRIACIGDSIAFGMGTPREPFSEQLEARLNKDRAAGAPTFEVLNFGVPGYHIGQVAAMLVERVPAFDPDLVLYLYCLNDPQETSRELEGTLRQAGVAPARQDYVRRLWAASESARGRGGSRLWLLARWAVASGSKRTAAAPRGAFRDDMQILLDGDGAAYYRSLYRAGPSRDRLHAGLDVLARWNRESGVPIRLVVVPVFLDLANYALGDLHAAVAAAAVARGLPVMDLLPVYQAAQRAGGPSFHADPLHPNREGYGLAARAVADVLRADRALERRPREPPRGEPAP